VKPDRPAAGPPKNHQWRLFEQEVARALAQLDPGATVQHDVTVRGGLSGAPRQVDALCTSRVVGREINRGNT